MDLCTEDDGITWMDFQTVDWDRNVAACSSSTHRLAGLAQDSMSLRRGEEGLEFKLNQNDKTFVQLDESSWKQDGSGTSVVTLYKLLVM